MDAESFTIEISQWVDPDGLIGANPHPPKWTSGNGILETAFAVKYLRYLKVRLDLAGDLTYSIGLCRAANGSFYKNPGRTDQITHDDLMAAASVSEDYARGLCDLGDKSRWQLSHDGIWYWDGWAKPWQVGFYKLAMDTSPGLVCGAALLASIYGAAGRLRAGGKHASDDRLTWLTLTCIKDRCERVNKAYQVWRAAMRSAYPMGVRELMTAYYGYSWHPYAKYGDLLDF